MSTKLLTNPLPLVNSVKGVHCSTSHNYMPSIFFCFITLHDATFHYYISLIQNSPPSNIQVTNYRYWGFWIANLGFHLQSTVEILRVLNFEIVLQLKTRVSNLGVIEVCSLMGLGVTIDHKIVLLIKKDQLSPLAWP